MSVIQDCMCSDVGDNLGDIEVCEMLETVLTTCCQMRLSGVLSRHLPEIEPHVLTHHITWKEILRRSAEATMHALVKTAFIRLYAVDPAEEEQKLADNDSNSQDLEGKMNVSTKPAEEADPPLQTAEDSETVDTPSPQPVMAAEPSPISARSQSRCMFANGCLL